MKNVMTFILFKIILNGLIAIGCVLASILTIALTPIYFFVKFIQAMFGCEEFDEIWTDYLHFWVVIWTGGLIYCRFY